jgi:hypothetical protein
MRNTIGILKRVSLFFCGPAQLFIAFFLLENQYSCKCFVVSTIGHDPCSVNAKFSSTRKRRTRPEDFVGKFLFSVAMAVVTTLITLACAGQAHWEYVVIVFLVALFLLVIYQHSK